MVEGKLQGQTQEFFVGERPQLFLQNPIQLFLNSLVHIRMKFYLGPPVQAVFRRNRFGGAATLQ
jgi:hypothetical protein